LYIKNFNSIKTASLPKKGGFFDENQINHGKKMNCYEHTFVAKSDLTENQIKNIVEKYENILKKNKGKIIKIEHWGLRMLSHKIKNNKKGFYLHFKIEADGDVVSKLEKEQSIDEMLLRFLTIKVKKHDLETVFFEKREN
tara:strand:+ start:96 stop:515 length:420 start_codon:yes stop_codon:yes gene_type:complete